MSNAKDTNYADTNALVEKLKHKVKNFAVINLKGERLGEVKNLVLDASRQLNLVVSRGTNSNHLQLTLLVSKLIRKIELANKAVLVDIEKAEIENLPEYVAIASGENQPDLSIPNVAAHTNEASFVNEHTDTTPTSLFEAPNMQNEVQNQFNLDSSQDKAVLGEEVIRLLEERVVVERSKRKVGEVIVRKEIGTRMVQVPVRYEKLIIEQVNPEHKQIAEIDLGQEEIPGIEIIENAIADSKTTSLLGQEEIPGIEITENAIADNKTTSLNGGLTVSGNFTSPKIASLLLNAIALERRHGCKQVRVEIVVEDEERKKTYQEWFERSSTKG